MSKSKTIMAFLLVIVHFYFWFNLYNQWEMISEPMDFYHGNSSWIPFFTPEIDAYVNVSDFQLNETTLYVDLYVRDREVKITHGAELNIFDRFRWDYEVGNESNIPAYFSKSVYTTPVEVGAPSRYEYYDIPIEPVGFGWYPFETYITDVFINIDKWGIYGGDREYLYIPNTEMYNDITGYDVEEDKHELGSTLTIRQSQNKKSLYISVTAIFAVFLYSIFFISDFNTFIQATMALLLGLWGLKEIYLPPDLPQKFSGGSELVLFYCYILLGITISFWVIEKTLFGKLSELKLFRKKPKRQNKSPE